jgi:transcriptional regulator with XRE-family HTH domain
MNLKNMKLKENLRLLIKTKGITATALSKQSKVPLQTLNNWLSGSKPKDLDQVKSVADVFGVSLDFLVYGIEQEKINATDLVPFGKFDVYLKRSP